jgi:hypothetical protein
MLVARLLSSGIESFRQCPFPAGAAWLQVHDVRFKLIANKNDQNNTA